MRQGYTASKLFTKLFLNPFMQVEVSDTGAPSFRPPVNPSGPQTPCHSKNRSTGARQLSTLEGLTDTIMRLRRTSLKAGEKYLRQGLVPTELLITPKVSRMAIQRIQNAYPTLPLYFTWHPCEIHVPCPLRKIPGVDGPCEWARLILAAVKKNLVIAHSEGRMAYSSF